MKKLITIFLCATCISVSAIAQSGVRIGNMEIIVRKTENDTVAQITVGDPCPPCPPEKEKRPKEKQKDVNINISDGFFGIGFILPNSNDYYPTLSPSSINLDIGGSRRYHLTRWLALGGTMQYSYYNYKLRKDMASDEIFVKEVIGETKLPSDIDKLSKQVFRSHNIGAGPFIRINLVPSSRPKKNDGFYIDFGAQGDFAFSKYYKYKTSSGGKLKNRNGDTLSGDVFNPFTASVIARMGWSDKAIFARYRFTDVFNSSALPMDLPPITIGIQFF